MVEAAIEEVERVAVSDGHACAVVSEGRLKCWGCNEYGQLGLGSMDLTRSLFLGGMGVHLPFVNLGQGVKVRNVEAGYGFTCVVLEPDGMLKCWGNNEYGALGIGSEVMDIGRRVAEMGEGLPSVNLGKEYLISLACGGYHVCVLFASEKVKCWGRNAFGQLGLGIHDASIGRSPSDFVESLPFIKLGQDLKVSAIAAGGMHTCALFKISLNLKCWGWNYNGQLGLGNTKICVGKSHPEMGDFLPFIDLGKDAEVLGVALGYAHSCAILAPNRSLKCWGANFYGQLGLGVSASSWGQTPQEMGDGLPEVDLGSQTKVLKVTLGDGSTCALLDGYRVKCWGYNENGQLGLEDSKDRGRSSKDMGESLVAIDFGQDLSPTDVIIRGGTACVLFDNQKVKCWGVNDCGQLGTCGTLEVGMVRRSMGDRLQYVDECPPTTSPTRFPGRKRATNRPSSLRPTRSPTARPVQPTKPKVAAAVELPAESASAPVTSDPTPVPSPGPTKKPTPARTRAPRTQSPLPQKKGGVSSERSKQSTKKICARIKSRLAEEPGSNEEMNPPIQYIAIPKSGPIALQEELVKGAQRFHIQSTRGDDESPIWDVPHKGTQVKGFFYGAKGLGFASHVALDTFPKPLYIVSLREPISRLLSLFDFVMSTGAKEHNYVRSKWKNLSFDKVVQRYNNALKSGIDPSGQGKNVDPEFVSFYRMMNQQVQFMCGYDCVFMPFFNATSKIYSRTRAAQLTEPEILERAMSNLHQVECISTYDHVDSILPQINSHLGWFESEDLNLPVENPDEMSTANENSMKLLQSWMESEITLYRTAQELISMRKTCR